MTTIPTKEQIVEAMAESLCKSQGGDWKYTSACKEDNGMAYQWHTKNARGALQAMLKLLPAGGGFYRSVPTNAPYPSTEAEFVGDNEAEFYHKLLDMRE